ncbi:MAG TPA: cation:proton antiporter [Acidimicrobiia bacterium]|nr:cation:proton antiporter [Acidimicrobiia bacterium]
MPIAASRVASISDPVMGQMVLAFLLLIAIAHLFGQLAGKIRQPRIIGEIAAGIVLGPSILGRLAPGVSAHIFGAGGADPRGVVLGFLYNLGLLLLMFVSGAAVRHVMGGENRRPTIILFAVGTTAPFLLALGLAGYLPLGRMMGPAGSRSALMLIIAAAVAVTSIPVITKIFSDLGILHTRFASLMLGSAVMEDIALWGIATIATAIASASASEGRLSHVIVVHILWNSGYVLVAMTLMPRVLRWLGHARWNVLAQRSQITWVMTVLFGYTAFAAAHSVNLAFAAFLAGYGIVGGFRSTERNHYRLSLDSISTVASGVFVPVYFAIIGFKLDFTKTFSPLMVVAFLVGSSVVHMLCLAGAARTAGFRRRAIFNLAVTSNARGGPGIVLAGVAFDARIINASFFTTLVLTAVLTSQVCGWWLERQLRAHKPLLGDDEAFEWAWTDEPEHTAAALTGA